MSTINQSIVNVSQTEPQPRLTGEELFALGDIGPCELVNGEIVKMSPTGNRHGSIESNFDFALKQFVRQHKLGHVRVGEVGIYIKRKPDTVRGADVAYISNERYAKLQSSSFIDVAPDLVVEIMSPDDRWNEVMRKLEESLGIGVRLIWIVDPETESIFAYHSMTDVRRFGKSEKLVAEDILPGFATPVEELFKEQ